MKKLLLSLTILLAINGCDSKKDEPSQDTGKQFADTAQGVIRNQYILFMTEAFGQPLINLAKDDPNRLIQEKNQQSARDSLEDKLVKYLRDRDITVQRKNVFVDVSVGAVLKLNQAEVNKLLADTVNVAAVTTDVIVQINPIQQTGPEGRDPMQQWTTPYIIAEINPIQQSGDSLTRFDIKISDSTTIAVDSAGGASADTHPDKVIWFLDSGIDLDNDNLNVQASWGVSFIDGVSSTDDDFGHGTFCAGIAAGKPVGHPDSGGLIHIGVSEGAKVVPVKVLDSNGTGAWSTVIKGLNHVAKRGNADDVANLSLGAFDVGNANCLPQNLGNAIRKLWDKRRIFVTMSAGNNQANAKFNMPGCTNGTNIFTASSIDKDMSCALYANFNQGLPLEDPVDYVTVGTRVFSLWKDGQFRMASGTSASSAILAGIIHTRAGPPVSGGSVDCLGKSYTIAKWR